MKRYLLLSLLSLTLSGTYAQTFKNQLGFTSDNDAYLFYGQDRYYTNGLFVKFSHATNQEQLHDEIEKKIISFTAGQMMFNPRSGYAPDPARQDRPFAGYLFAEGAMSWLRKNESSIKASLQLGTTGPAALADKGQELLHNTVGFYEPEGWEYQIKNELAINAALHYSRLLHRADNLKTDFLFDGYARVGTTFSGAGAGVLFRAGNINQLFNSAAQNAVISNNSQTRTLVPKELFFYARPQLNLVAYDATIRGSMFNDDSPVTFGIKPLVFSQQLGVNYSTARFTADFSLLFKTKEVKSAAKAHQYGSISLFYRFN